MTKNKIMFWALCRRCKNNLLEVYFKKNAIGARCGFCKYKVFELDGANLDDVLQSEEKRPIEDRIQPMTTKKKNKERIIN